MNRKDMTDMSGKSTTDTFPSRQLERGFSLIEVAVVMLIISILAIPLMHEYSLYLRDLEKQDTDEALNEIPDALDIYVENNLGYPVPASLALGPGDPGYGEEGASAHTPALCTSPTWFTTDGYCSTGGAAPVLIGAVPFAALGISERYSLDAWDNKIIYAVSADRTVSHPAVFDPTISPLGGGGDGDIIVRAYDGNHNPVTVDTASDVFIFSTGPTANGGFSRDGVQLNPCIGGFAEAEDENCDLDNTFFLDESPIVNPVPFADYERSKAWNTVAGPDFFDDYTYSYSEPSEMNWRRHNAMPDFAFTLASRIGIGIEDPHTQLHVDGDTLVQGQVQSDTYCDLDAVGVDLNSDGIPDPAAANCFNPEVIGGTLPSMDCTQNGLENSGEPDTSIKPITSFDAANEKVNCASSVDTGGSAINGDDFQFPGFFPNTDCEAILGAGAMMVGFDNATGMPKCAL